MDLTEIGKFLADLRRGRNLTQEQLGEIIGVSNKTVSRWETGVYLPPADALLALSRLYDVSINEILSARRLSAAEYKAAAEENLTRTISASSFTLKERIDFYKQKWLKEHKSAMLLAGLCIAAVFAAAIVFRSPVLTGISVLMLPVAHGWRHNAMMTYVENRAFDGSGPDEC